MIHFVILAAGQGKRALSSKNKLPKQFYQTKGITPLEHILNSVNTNPLIDTITVVLSNEYYKKYDYLLNEYNKITKIVKGGSNRQESSFKALNNIVKTNKNYKNDFVLLHDAARPFLEDKIINQCIKNCNKYDGVFPSINIDDTLRNKKNFETVDRNSLLGSQTPQAFKLNKILSAYKNVKSNFTDDIAIAHEYGLKLKRIRGSKLNFKITDHSDLIMFDKLINHSYTNKVGIGYDFHKFKKGNFIKLGGLRINGKYSLDANSDGDPVLHSITDAILGALGKNDIGHHFKPNDKKYKNMDSLIFINKALGFLEENYGKISNLDINIICDYPKIDPLKEKIKINLSKILSTRKDKINVKASSTEGEGFVNSKNGIASQSIISIMAQR
ncbi:MAG: 2-C-methyl-D-erythritol 2,4-cyclodiphosphate synthase [Pseudomonadota bacterium]|nr:2-C-methyl-D-erythritol 2,4-cyclodiphosphate synthase [Pseudomonadota bacterium]